MKRVATWTLVVLVALVGAFLAGDLIDPIESAGEASPTPSPAPTDTRSPTPEPTTEPTPDPDNPASYFTTDGSDPALFPGCTGTLGLCLGSPVDRATAAFGIENERFGGADPGSVVRAWNLDRIRLTVEADDVGSITSLSVSIPTEDSIRVALPEGIVLGDVTLGEVVDRLGPPQQRDDFAAENVWFYIYAYPYGPEGSHKLTFGHSKRRWAGRRGRPRLRARLDVHRGVLVLKARVAS